MTAPHTVAAGDTLSAVVAEPVIEKLRQAQAVADVFNVSADMPQHVNDLGGALCAMLSLVEKELRALVSDSTAEGGADTVDPSALGTTDATRQQHAEAGGDFGLDGVKLSVQGGAPLDVLLFASLCLLDCALATFEAIEGATVDVHPAHFAGLYLLRQSRVTLEAAQVSPQQAANLAPRS
jgi:hypothetical protein